MKGQHVENIIAFISIFGFLSVTVCILGWIFSPTDWEFDVHMSMDDDMRQVIEIYYNDTLYSNRTCYQGCTHAFEMIAHDTETVAIDDFEKVRGCIRYCKN